jgi:phosphohistidine phosphatase SixA
MGPGSVGSSLIHENEWMKKLPSKSAMAGFGWLRYLANEQMTLYVCSHSSLLGSITTATGLRAPPVGSARVAWVDINDEQTKNRQQLTGEIAYLRRQFRRRHNQQAAWTSGCIQPEKNIRTHK